MVTNVKIGETNYDEWNFNRWFERRGTCKMGNWDFGLHPGYHLDWKFTRFVCYLSQTILQQPKKIDENAFFYYAFERGWYTYWCSQCFTTNGLENHIQVSVLKHWWFWHKLWKPWPNFYNATSSVKVIIFYILIFPNNRAKYFKFFENWRNFICNFFLWFCLPLRILVFHGNIGKTENVFEISQFQLTDVSLKFYNHKWI